MKQIVKKLVPAKLLKYLRPMYHGAISLCAHWYFRRPSHSLVVIGVTGTKGKSTTVNFIAQTLRSAGIHVGYLSTVEWDYGAGPFLNKLKMTMTSGWLIHKALRKMVARGCTHAVVEISSEGLVQNRHLGIRFHTTAFTNLTPEHIESHGSYENYKRAKGILFALPHHVSVVNIDSADAEFFYNFPSHRKISVGRHNDTAEVQAELLQEDIDKIAYLFSYQGKRSEIVSHVPGEFNLDNILVSSGVAFGLNLDYLQVTQALSRIHSVPGRLEVVYRQHFTVVVDYAYEPASLKASLSTVRSWAHNRIIHVTGSCGGGRDADRREVIGRLSANLADITIVTNEDPYDDDPREIIEQVAAGSVKAGRIAGESLFIIEDRTHAIRTALSLATPGDIVLITGKGAEQSMAVAHGMYTPWDDRQVVKQQLQERSSLPVKESSI